MLPMLKYPRTFHLAGSRLQPGDDGMGDVPLSTIAGRHVVIEEKIDGANAGLSFDDAGRLYLQSRGHYLTGGPREKHFTLFKQWANAHAADLFDLLGSRYVVYGEWLYARHTVYYDLLPHYFLEFDVLDRVSGDFLSTERRRQLLECLPIVSVPVLRDGTVAADEDLNELVGPSLYKGPEWRERLRQTCLERGIDPEQALRETDPSDLAEGLYLKVEEEGRVVERYKFVRASFLNTRPTWPRGCTSRSRRRAASSSATSSCGPVSSTPSSTPARTGCAVRWCPTASPTAPISSDRLL
jgi:hypothetical protein